jgi:hypothetical protein
MCQHLVAVFSPVYPGKHKRSFRGTRRAAGRQEAEPSKCEKIAPGFSLQGGRRTIFEHVFGQADIKIHGDNPTKSAHLVCSLAAIPTSFLLHSGCNNLHLDVLRVADRWVTYLGSLASAFPFIDLSAS